MLVFDYQNYFSRTVLVLLIFWIWQRQLLFSISFSLRTLRPNRARSRNLPTSLASRRTPPLTDSYPFDSHSRHWPLLKSRYQSLRPDHCGDQCVDCSETKKPIFSFPASPLHYHHAPSSPPRPNRPSLVDHPLYSSHKVNWFASPSSHHLTILHPLFASLIGTLGLPASNHNDE